MAMSFARPDPSSPASVADAGFGTTRRGFDQDEVRDFLRMVAAELGRLQERERFLERELRMTQKNPSLDAVKLDDQTLTRLLGEETTRVLTTARESALEIRSKAEQSVAQMLTEAGDEASRVREEAEIEASRRRSDSGADAEAEVAMAKQQGREMVNEARAYRERVLSELARRRELAREQIEQLLHGRDRLMRSFEQARIVAVDVVADLQPLGEPDEYVNLAPTTGPLPVMVPNSPRPQSSTAEPVESAESKTVVPDKKPSTNVPVMSLVGRAPERAVADDTSDSSDETDVSDSDNVDAEAAEPGAVGTNIVEMDVAQTDVSDADAAETDIAGTDIADAGDGETNIAGTDIADAGDGETNIAGTDIADADVAQTNISGAGVSAVGVGETGIAGTDVADADVGETGITGTNIADADVAETGITGTDVAEADVGKTHVAGTDIADAGVTEADVGKTNIVRIGIAEAGEGEIDEDAEADGVQDADDADTANDAGDADSVGDADGSSTDADTVNDSDGLDGAGEVSDIAPETRDVENADDVENSDPSTAMVGVGTHTDDVDDHGEAESVEFGIAEDHEQDEPDNGRRDDVVVDLFARLRADARPGEVRTADGGPADVQTGDVRPSDVHPAGGTSDESSPEPLEVDDSDLDNLEPEPSPFEQRDADLTPLIVSSAKRLKRVLADEQNEVLEALRRSEPVTEIVQLIPQSSEHVVRYADAINDDLKAAANAGSASVSSATNSELSAADATKSADAAGEVLGEWLVAPLRERLERCVSEAGGDNAEIVKRVRAIYREFKTQRIDEQLDDVVRAAHGRGVLAAVVPGSEVIWTADRTHSVCADCDDNTLAGTVFAGEVFPTGHLFAPAHIGCRCLLVPAAR